MFLRHSCHLRGAKRGCAGHYDGFNSPCVGEETCRLSLPHTVSYFSLTVSLTWAAAYGVPAVGVKVAVTVTFFFFHFFGAFHL